MTTGASTKTYYKRLLPSPPAIAFSSTEGIRLFQEALAAGTASSFFKLVEQYRTQSEPAFCGLTSIAMVLNALAIDPRRTWKAPWRWFDESLLDCCKPLSKIQKEGVSLTQAACLAQCNGARVTIHKFGEFSLETFRELVRSSCHSVQQHLIVSYSRATMSQTGSGHFSPVGAYHASNDMVLILDTARFKYPPHWVPLNLLYTAMEPMDEGASQRRGFLTLTAPEIQSSVYFTLNRRDEWQAAKDFIITDVPQLFQEFIKQNKSFEDILKTIVSRSPISSVESFLAIRERDCIPSCDSLYVAQEQFLLEFKQIPLYQLVNQHLQLNEQSIGRVTILLLLRSQDEWLEEVEDEGLKAEAKKYFEFSEGSLVKPEVSFLQHQLKNLVHFGELPNQHKDYEWMYPFFSIDGSAGTKYTRIGYSFLEYFSLV